MMLMTEKEYKYIFDSYNKELIRFSTELVGNLLGADFVQDSFLELWHKRNEKHSNVKSFLFTCVRNKCLNHLKREAVKNKFTEYVEYLYEPAEDFVEAKMIRSALIQRIIKEVEIAPPQRKNVIKLICSNLSHEEIADALNISALTVSVHLKRFIDNFGKAALNKKLILLNGKRQSIAAWARELSLDPSVIGKRIRNGLPPQIALKH